jgi:hypothetical protein
LIDLAEGSITQPSRQGVRLSDGMRDEDWQGLESDALERILVERWLYRGLMLGVMFVAAIVVTWLGVRGVADLANRVTVGVLLALALAAGAVAFTMRLQDLRIHRELRRRRQEGPRA